MLRVTRKALDLVSGRGARRALGRALAPGWAGLVLFGAAGMAVAETPEGLAPPGVCAEPREAVIGVAPPSVSNMIGPLSSLFSPSAVSAAPPPPSRPPPSAARTVRPGACDQPGAGCVAKGGVGAPIVGAGDRP